MRYYLFMLFLIVLHSACTENSNAIKIKGSDTEVNLAVQLAESFHTNNSEVFISISGGGSGLGIASLFNGTADVANSSRSINRDEMNLFLERGEKIDSFVFAEDAVAFVVADNLPIDSISTTELAKILRGDYTNWTSLTGRDLPINIYGRQSNSGTHDYIKNKLQIEFTPYAKQMNGNAQILEAIKADNSGIGYVGAGYVLKRNNKGIKVLSISSGLALEAISPFDALMIRERKYFFQRPLFQYYKIKSYSKIQPFLDFEKTEAGKSIIESAGYYTIK